MANATTLDYSGVAAHIQAIRSGMENIRNYISICNKATETAQQKSSPMRFIEEFAAIGAAAEKQSREVGDCVTDMLTALQKYNTQLEEFASTGANFDD